MSRAFRVLFLCTGNSARSILAESILGRLGTGRFEAVSAGSHPRGSVHPQALRLLQDLGDPVGHLRSKSWDELAGPDRPAIDLVVTVCDDAAGEACPVWPGHPMTVHWGIPDPAAVRGSDREIARAFTRAHGALEERIRLLVALPVESLDRATLKARLEEIHARSSARRA